MHDFLFMTCLIFVAVFAWFGRLNPMSYEARTDRYDKMPYKRCGRSGLKLPRLSLGLWHNFGGVDDLENSRRLLRFEIGRAHV